MDWPAKQVAAALETTVGSVNSALQRAHATMAGHLPADDSASGSTRYATERERALLDGMIAAWERADAAALAALLREDARLVMPPTRSWYDGRAAIVAFFAGYAFGPNSAGRFRALPTAANRQPALAVYMSAPGGGSRKPFALIVLRVTGEAIAEMTLFGKPGLFRPWGLPAAL